MENDAAPVNEIAPDESAVTSEVQEMYDELGIEATAPTSKAEGRPKTSSVRAKNDKADGDKDTDSDKQEEAESKSKQKDAQASDTSKPSGDKADKKGEEKRVSDGEVPPNPDETDKGDGEAKSESDEDTERGGDGDAERTDDGNGKEGEKPEGKREGKSNPEVEKRFQKLTGEIKERDALIEKLQKDIEANQRQQYELQSSQEDPEYKLEDFKTVRDEYGEIHELDDDQAELAYRRWKDGYDSRSAEREANFEKELESRKSQEEAQYQLIQSSVAAQDTLVEIMQNTPELNADSDKFDAEFSAQVLPAIKEAIIYAPDGKTVLGFAINPNTILNAVKAVRDAKPRVSINGLADSAESSSNLNVRHSRPSDPDMRAVQEMYDELGIKKKV